MGPLSPSLCACARARFRGIARRERERGGGTEHREKRVVVRCDSREGLVRLCLGEKRTSRRVARVDKMRLRLWWGKPGKQGVLRRERGAPPRSVAPLASARAPCARSLALESPRSAFAASAPYLFKRRARSPTSLLSAHKQILFHPSPLDDTKRNENNTHRVSLNASIARATDDAASRRPTRRRASLLGDRGATAPRARKETGERARRVSLPPPRARAPRPIGGAARALGRAKRPPPHLTHHHQTMAWTVYHYASVSTLVAGSVVYHAFATRR